CRKDDTPLPTTPPRRLNCGPIASRRGERNDQNIHTGLNETRHVLGRHSHLLGAGLLRRRAGLVPGLRLRKRRRDRPRRLRTQLGRPQGNLGPQLDHRLPRVARVVRGRGVHGVLQRDRARRGQCAGLQWLNAPDPSRSVRAAPISVSSAAARRSSPSSPSAEASASASTATTATAPAKCASSPTSPIPNRAGTAPGTATNGAPGSRPRPAGSPGDYRPGSRRRADRRRSRPHSASRWAAAPDPMSSRPLDRGEDPRAGRSWWRSTGPPLHPRWIPRPVTGFTVPDGRSGLTLTRREVSGSRHERIHQPRPAARPRHGPARAVPRDLPHADVRQHPHRRLRRLEGLLDARTRLHRPVLDPRPGRPPAPLGLPGHPPGTRRADREGADQRQLLLRPRPGRGDRGPLRGTAPRLRLRPGRDPVEHRRRHGHHPGGRPGRDDGRPTARPGRREGRRHARDGPRLRMTIRAVTASGRRDNGHMPANEPIAADRPADARAEGLTVGRAAALVGVSVKTLHHWDEIGLVRPGDRTPAGYRVYSSGDIARVHRVLVYRELGFELAEIGRLLDDPDVDAIEHLCRQRSQLMERIGRVERMVGAVDRLLEASRRGVLLSPSEQAEIFGDHWRPEWGEKAGARWGDTPQWRQYAERAATKTPLEWKAHAADADALHAEL